MRPDFLEYNSNTKPPFKLSQDQIRLSLREVHNYIVVFRCEDCVKLSVTKGKRRFSGSLSSPGNKKISPSRIP